MRMEYFLISYPENLLRERRSSGKVNRMFSYEIYKIGYHNFKAILVSLVLFHDAIVIVFEGRKRKKNNTTE